MTRARAEPPPSGAISRSAGARCTGRSAAYLDALRVGASGTRSSRQRRERSPVSRPGMRSGGITRRFSGGVDLVRPETSWFVSRWIMRHADVPPTLAQ